MVLQRLGYALLGQIVAAVGEQPYREIVDREIIARLDLTDTTCGCPTERDANVALGDRGLDANPRLALASLPGTADVWSTAHDLVAYVTAFQDGRLVRPSTSRTLLESSVDLGDGAFTTEWVSASRYAYGRYLGELAGHQAFFTPVITPASSRSSAICQTVGRLSPF